jgi:hypothetical protein
VILTAIMVVVWCFFGQVLVCRPPRLCFWYTPINVATRRVSCRTRCRFGSRYYPGSTASLMFELWRMLIVHHFIRPLGLVCVRCFSEMNLAHRSARPPLTKCPTSINAPGCPVWVLRDIAECESLCIFQPKFGEQRMLGWRRNVCYPSLACANCLKVRSIGARDPCQGCTGLNTFCLDVE